MASNILAPAPPQDDDADAERAWNAAHGLTASCTECGGAMKDDGREFCTFACYHRSRRHGAGG